MQKELRKLSQWIIFRNFIMEWEKMKSHQKGFLRLKCSSPLKLLTFPLFEETLVAFFAPSLEDSGVLMIFEEKITPSKTSFSNELTWNGMVMTVDILAVDAYSGMELCTPI
jgi:hypothetical protein